MSKLFENVTSLDVNLSSSSNQAVVYANGLNQVAININFIVTDKYDNQVMLTDEQIRQCVFVGDYNLGTVLFPGQSSDGWVASTEPGDFITTGDLNTSLRAGDTYTKELTDSSDRYQGITYYMSCNEYHAYSRTFCGFISPDNLNTYVTSAHGTQFDNGVVLTPLPEISYDYSELTFLHTEPASSEYGQHHVEQVDYYVSLPSGSIKKGEVDLSYNQLYYIQHYSSTEDRYQACFNVGEEATWTLTLPDGTRIPVEYNKRAGQQSLVCLKVTNGASLYALDQGCRSTIYDAYGNHGHLEFVTQNSGSTIKLYNA
ncbi:hypothetical protein EB837_06195 [Kluyvera ascorbata]|uniref:Uncharacterized protein n=1 Tax=Kluyvera ascorbata TaxID=51288 RepID=A0A3N2S847_9ENTR|nr:hypothetical protein [Kluyvera ascorbata]ROU15902.1 hypothetical protein EB837_06195 [Kluyvera ascorbata]